MEGTGCYRCGKCPLRTTECGSGTKSDIADEVFGECSKLRRSDSKSVIFKKLEKVGEPYMSNGHLMQTLSGEKQPNSIRDYKTRMCYYANCILRIEIKQNKEDMEEREYSEEDMKNNPRFKHHKNIEQVINMQKMKPFDLEAAKAGKPVCTRDGRKARIICFDLNNKNFPIVAIINCDTEENAYQYDIDGVCDEHDNNLNLMMIPKKKEGWIIIHKEAIYDKETAEKIAKETTADVIRIQKIEWEE